MPRRTLRLRAVVVLWPPLCLCHLAKQSPSHQNRWQQLGVIRSRSDPKRRAQNPCRCCLQHQSSQRLAHGPSFQWLEVRHCHCRNYLRERKWRCVTNQGPMIGPLQALHDRNPKKHHNRARLPRSMLKPWHAWHNLMRI